MSFHAPLVAVAALAASAHALPSTDVAPAPADVLLALDVGDATVQTLVVPPLADGPFEVDVVLDGAARTLVLEPRSLLADDFVLLAQVGAGEIVEVEPAPSNTFQGRVEGLADSVVAVSLDATGIRGVVRLRTGGPLWGVQPLAPLVPWAERFQHAVFAETDNVPGPWSCGTADGFPVPGASTSGARTAGTGGLMFCEIACDADVEFYNKNGSSVTQTQNDITAVLNGCDAIYLADANVQYSIGTILVRTVEPDPYTQRGPSALLTEFTAEWLANQSSIQRDVAHLFTGKNLSGSVIGVANLGGICSLGLGYGLSESRFTSNMTSRIGLTAHELGHNWGSNHCDSDGDCRIMCSCLGCCGSVTQFGSRAQTAIASTKASVLCLSYPPPTVPPVLTSVTPSSLSAFTPGALTLTGAGFLTLDSIDLGGVQLTQPNDFRATCDDKLFIGSPPPLAIGPVSVTVTNAIGTSAAHTVTYFEASPPRLLADPLAIGTYPFDWDIGARSGDLWFVLLDLSNGALVPYGGTSVLGNAFVLAGGVCDAIGVGKHSIVVPLGLRGLAFWSQAVTYDPATLVFDDASSVVPSVVFY